MYGEVLKPGPLYLRVGGSLVRILPLENTSRAVDMSASGGLESLSSSEEKEEEEGSMMLI